MIIFPNAEIIRSMINFLLKIIIKGFKKEEEEEGELKKVVMLIIM